MSSTREKEPAGDERIIPRYSPQVRTGNWVEDLYRETEDSQTYSDMKKRGETNLQKLEQTQSNLLSPVTLPGPSFEVKFGDAVQICIPGFRPMTGSNISDEVLALSLHVPSSELDKHQKLYDGVGVTIAHNCGPAVRNCFKVEPVRELPSGQFKYETEFYLKTAGDDNLLLCAFPPCAGSVEENSDSGLKLGLMLDNNRMPRHYCRWKIEHIYPQLRSFSLSTPVPTNKQVYIIHSFTNQYLTGMKNIVSTTFGNELEVRVKKRNVHNLLDFNESVNWLLCTKSNYKQ